MNRIFGGSSGDFYRFGLERNSDENISKFFVVPGSSTLQIMVHDVNNLSCNISEPLIAAHFTACSIHAPGYAYQHDEMSYQILDFLSTLCAKFAINNIVIHPDTVVDWSVFLKYPKLPISIENMDDRKDTFKSVSDLKKILDANPNLGFTLDLQHAFVNDPSMQLARDFHTALGDRLVGYHISGYDEKILHYPLFKTHQDVIIKALERSDLPIIIESTFDEVDGLQREIEYIENVLDSMK